MDLTMYTHARMAGFLLVISFSHIRLQIDTYMLYTPLNKIHAHHRVFEPKIDSDRNGHIRAIYIVP